MIKFRKEQVDEIKVLNAHTPQKLEEQIRELGTTYDLIDLQYSVNTKFKETWFSALLLLKKKKLHKSLFDILKLRE